MHELVCSFRSWMVAQQRYSPLTVEHYIRSVRVLLDTPHAITAAGILAHLGERPGCRATVAARLSGIRLFCPWARREGILTAEEMELIGDIPRPKLPKCRPRPFTEADAVKIIETDPELSPLAFAPAAQLCR